MTRKSTCSNSDGLVMGYGTTESERNLGAVTTLEGGNVKTARLSVNSKSTFGASGAKISIPANSLIKTVYMKVGTAWVGGTSLAFGDAGSTGGWVTATQGATASLTLNTPIPALGAYAYTATEGQLPPKVYAAATDLYITAVGTFTAGTADIYVEYV